MGITCTPAVRTGENFVAVLEILNDTTQIRNYSVNVPAPIGMKDFTWDVYLSIGATSTVAHEPSAGIGAFVDTVTLAIGARAVYELRALPSVKTVGTLYTFRPNVGAVQYPAEVKVMVDVCPSRMEGDHKEAIKAAFGLHRNNPTGIDKIQVLFDKANEGFSMIDMYRWWIDNYAPSTPAKSPVWDKPPKASNN